VQSWLPVLPVERVEYGDAVRTAHHRLAVERERLGAQQHRGDGDRGVTAAPVVTFSGEEAHGVAVTPDLQPIAVVFDLVHPVGAGRRLGSHSRAVLSREPVRIFGDLKIGPDVHGNPITVVRPGLIERVLQAFLAAIKEGFERTSRVCLTTQPRA
jgi:hypothetical protein